MNNPPSTPGLPNPDEPRWPSDPGYAEIVAPANGPMTPSFGDRVADDDQHPGAGFVPSAEGRADVPAVRDDDRAVHHIGRASLVDRAAEIAELEAAKELARERVGFHFVRAGHVPENVEKVAASLTTAGCATVAFELVGGDPELRRTLVDAMNVYHDKTLPDTARQVAAGVLASNGLHYIKGVIDHLTPAVQRIKIIDIDDRHPAYAKVERSDEADRAFTAAIMQNRPHLTQRELARMTIECLADEFLDREPVMADQLVDMAVEEAPLGPHIIGPVTGTAHTAPYDMVSGDGFRCTASPSFVASGYPQMTVRLAQQLMSDRNAGLDPLQLDRALLEALGLRHNISDQISLGLATHLADGQVAETLELIESAKQSGGPPENMFSSIRRILLQASERFADPQA